MTVPDDVFEARVQADVAALNEWRTLIRRVAEGLNMPTDLTLRYYMLARMDLVLVQLHRLNATGGDEGWRG